MALVDRAAPVLAADLFPVERAELLQTLRGLTADEWQASTVCPGWSVADVVRHLLVVDLQQLSGGRDAFAPPGTIGPHDRGFDALVSFLDEQNERRVDGLRWLSPGVLVDLLAATGPLVHAAVAAMDPDAIGQTVSWASDTPAPNWLHVARELTERWTHQQQIRDATGRPTLAGPLLHACLATFARALPRAFADAEAPVGTVAHLQVTGADGGDWYVVRDDGGDRRVWALGDEAARLPAAPSAAAVVDQDTAWRRLTKGIDVSAARSVTALRGDERLAERLLHAVAVIG